MLYQAFLIICQTHGFIIHREKGFIHKEIIGIIIIMHKTICNDRTDMEISIHCSQKRLQKKIDKLSYLNDLSDELQIKYDRIFRSFSEIIELNNNT